MPSPTNIRLSTIGDLAKPPVIADLMARALETPGLLSLAAGFTDNLTLPDKLIDEALTHINKSTKDREHLQYGTNQGRCALRQHAINVVQSHPDEKLDTLTIDNAIISNGSQQSLYLCMQTLCNPGDIVLVQRPSYFVFLELLKGLGIQALSIPSHDNGDIDADALSTLLADLKQSGDIDRLKAVYLVNYYANPSSRCMPLEQKERLALTLSNAIDPIPILEDAAYREIYFEKPWPAQSILSMPAFDAFPRLYFGTFTKPFATGLKVGFCLSDNDLILEKMLCMKAHQDFGTANFNQAIIETMLSMGRYEEHLASIRPHYKAKAEMMHELLGKTDLKKHGWSWELPEGGLLFWLTAPKDMDCSDNADFCKRCIDNKVLYVPGDLCFGDKPDLNHVRLSFGAIHKTDMEEAIKRFASAAIT